jgi:formyl-CoA transferase
MGLDALIADPRFATKTARHAHARELTAILDATFATRPLAAWRSALDAEGVMFSIVGTVDDLPDDPQMREAQVLVPFEGSDLLTVNSPMWVDGAAKVTPRMAPRVGEHSDEVLREAGYDEREIAALRAAGAVP